MRRHSEEYKKRRACWELTHSEGWPVIKKLIRYDTNVNQIRTLDDAFRAGAELSKKQLCDANIATIERLSEEYTTVPVIN